VRGWRTAIRIARREARRAKGRAALVIAMIAVPVAALAFGAVIQDTFTLKPDEQADRLMGSASALVMWPYGGPTVQDATQPVYFPAGGPITQPNPQTTAPTTERVLAELPAGSRAITEQRVSLGVHTVGGTASLGARLLDYADPLARGLYRTASGRPPTTADEIALTPAASRAPAPGSAAPYGSRTAAGPSASPGSWSSRTICARKCSSCVPTPCRRACARPTRATPAGSSPPRTA
jgi:putative ABC transport system permease protein